MALSDDQWLECRYHNLLQTLFGRRNTNRDDCDQRGGYQ